jgi:hydroxypyruvate reductase
MNDKTREALQQIFRAGIRAVDPEEAVKRHLELDGGLLRVGGCSYEIDRFERIFVTGCGTGTAPMARALEQVLGDFLTDGWIIVKYGHGMPLKKIRVMEAGHPVPDAAGSEAAGFILERLESCGERDLVICAFSGGGSALFPVPRPPVTLSDKQETTRLLLESGATIFELNALRKHLSRAKGGQLAKIACPARVVSLFLSDVVGDPLDVIASGPTVADPSTFADCLGIVEKYGLAARIPDRVFNLLQEGAGGLIEETPKLGDAAFERVQNVIVGSNRLALLAAAREAAALGYVPLVLTSFFQGEAREIAQAFTAIGKEIVASGNPVRPPACVLAGGETTVTVRGGGKGGRSQELALAAAISLEGWPQISLLSAGTDGSDGPTDAAGAFADAGACSRAAQKGLNPYDHLSRNDSYNFFEATGDLFITGPTRTNVMDLLCMIVESWRDPDMSDK